MVERVCTCDDGMDTGIRAEKRLTSFAATKATPEHHKQGRD